MNVELKETRELCKALTQFLGNYLQATRGTGDAPSAEAAAGRVTDALTDCLSKATIELPDPDSQARPMTFDCKSCGGNHDLVRDRTVLESGKFRWRMTKPAVGSDNYETPEHVVLMRALDYRCDHAKEAIRQLELRGYATGRREAETLVPA
jgi:hypothetical protein